MITEAQWLWINDALDRVHSGEMTPLAAAKTMRIVGQLFLMAAERAENQFMDAVEQRLFTQEVTDEH